jgi:hypothetical protein
VWHDISRSELARRSPLAASKLAISTSRGLDEVVRQILAVVRPPLPPPAPHECSLRFSDTLYADPVSAKTAVATILGKDATVRVYWPPLFDTLLEQIEALQGEAERYFEADSCFHQSPAEHVANFIDSTRLAVSSARRLRLNVPNRVPALIKGMSEYWSGMTFLIERSLVNFLTLANFDAQRALAYCLRYEAVADRMPQDWLRWFEPPRSSHRMYGELFGIDEEICSALIHSISDVYVNQFVWGPKWMVMEAARSQADKPIANPWFVKYLIPQIELALSWNPDSAVLAYRERALVNKVVSESGEELY